jgi:hypothetical protein
MYILSNRQTYKKLVTLVSLIIISAYYAAAENLIIDQNYVRGVNVYSNTRDPFTGLPKLQGVINRTDSTEKPVWRLNQWATASSLIEAVPKKLDNGSTKWVSIIVDKAGKETEYKAVTLPSSEADDGITILSLSGLNEFRHRQRVSKSSEIYLASLNDPWPSLLLGQTLNTLSLSNYTKVIMSMEARRLYDRRNIQQGYNAARHAGRFLVIFSLVNIFSGNNIWLVAPIYDDRYSFSDFGCKKCLDKECFIPDNLDQAGEWQCPIDGDRRKPDATKTGTWKMLFRIPTKAMTEKDIHGGDWVSFQVDLLPYCRAAIDAARNDDMYKGFSYPLSHYRLGFVTLGWEVNGLNDVSMAFRNFTLEAVTKNQQ